MHQKSENMWSFQMTPSNYWYVTFIWAKCLHRETVFQTKVVLKSQLFYIVQRNRHFFLSLIFSSIYSYSTSNLYRSTPPYGVLLYLFVFILKNFMLNMHFRWLKFCTYILIFQILIAYFPVFYMCATSCRNFSNIPHSPHSS